MAVYEDGDAAINSGKLTQTEVFLYGSSRLGLWRANRLVEDWVAPAITPMVGLEGGTTEKWVRGVKIFELSNHLGNVLLTVSDKKIAHDSGNGTVDYYTADIVTANDYYSGGMQMPGRKWSSSSYRYGFNGMEEDDEVKGEGNSLDFGARIYDPRISRWLSVDPLQQKYPSLSPYNFSNSNPIIYKDIDGRDWIITITQDKDGNKTVLLKLTAAVVNNSSNTSLDVNKFAQNSAQQIKNVYSVSYNESVYDKPFVIPSNLDNYPSIKGVTKKDVKVTFKVEVDIRVINSETELRKDEHLISIENDANLSPTATAETNKLGGKKISVKESTAQDVITGPTANTQTIAHEAGHTLGLKHSDVKYENNWDKLWGNESPDYISNTRERNRNVMSSFIDNTAVRTTVYQMKQIIKNIQNGKVNKK